MKRIVLSLLAVAFCAGVFATETTATATNYRDKENWVIREEGKDKTDLDVFYVYPTLFLDPARPYMNWKDDPKLRRKTVGFAKMQTGIFGRKTRVFAPYVRQLDYSRTALALSPVGDWRIVAELEPGARDTEAAFRYYLEHFNGGRPYVLLGHSQGSMDLYLVMKRNASMFLPERGFVAAYLIGLPRLSARNIADDGLRPAAGADDVGVVVGWNTQSRKAKNPVFTGQRTYCINPLNWRTDETPAASSENLGAFFYDYRNGRSCSVRHFCGARIDCVSGALIVDLPENGKYDAKGFMGKGVFHMNDVWFFAGNIRENARRRLEAWRKCLPAH